MKHRIAQVNFTGKWVEFWFGDKYVEGSDWPECCKGYILEEAVEQADLWHRVMNYGYVGLWVTWVAGESKPTKIEAEGESTMADTKPPQGDTFSHCCRCNASHNVTEMWTKPGRGYLCETCTTPPLPPSAETLDLQAKLELEEQYHRAAMDGVWALEREKTVLSLAIRASIWNDDLVTLRREAERRQRDEWHDKHAEAIKLATKTEDDEESR